MSLALAKWIVVLGGLAAVYPAGWLLRTRPRAQRFLLVLIGLLPFLGVTHLSLNPISYETYRGDARGLEVTLLDFVIWVLAVALPPARFASPYRRLRWIYFAVAAASMLTAPLPLFAFFGVWKLVRLYILIAVVARACEDDTVPPLLLRGLAIGVAFEGLVALDQRYIRHFYQSLGTFPHPNSLAMACNLVAPIAFSVVLFRERQRAALVALAGGALCVILALSRGGMAMFALAMVIVFAGSAARGITGRKFAVALAGLGALLVAAFFYASTLINRFENAPKESAESRILFKRAAAAMLADHPFGIGMNQFSWVLEHLGYAQRIGIPGYDASGIVHNIYWLTAAELGYVGLVAYLMLLWAPLATALFYAALARPDDIRGHVLLGCAAGFLVTYAQGTLEWLPRQTDFATIFWSLAAMTAALSRGVRASAGVSDRDWARAMLGHKLGGIALISARR